MTIKTTYKIGDLVYTANQYDIDREVIKAIKIVGLNEAISYGIKEKGSRSLLFWVSGDGYSWFSSNQIFASKEEAESLHNSLKAKAEAAQAKEDAKKKAERLKELKKEQAAIEAGEEYDPYEDD